MSDITVPASLTLDSAAFIGPAGPSGDPGPQGVPGPIGPIGPQGPAGPGSGSSTSAPIVLTNGSDILIEGKSFSGPIVAGNGGSSDAAGYGIHAVGTAAAHIKNLTIRRCTFSGFFASIWAGFVDNLVIEDCVATDAQYAGLMALSIAGGSLIRNSISRVGIGGTVNVSNAYGIAVSQQQPTTDPPSNAVIVADNLVDTVPTWQAIDTHGGVNCQLLRNTVRNSRNGIFVTSGSATLRSKGTLVQGNLLFATPGSSYYGIVFVYSDGGDISGNTISGWPTGHAILTSSSGDPAAVPNPMPSMSANTVQ